LNGPGGNQSGHSTLLQIGAPVSLSLGRLGVSVLSPTLLTPTASIARIPPLAPKAQHSMRIQTTSFFQNAQHSKTGQLLETLQ
jgi:hypothetical protein